MGRRSKNGGMGRLGSLSSATGGICRAYVVVWMATFFLAGCSVDRDANSGYGCDGCPAEKCYKGRYCLSALQTTSGPSTMPTAGASCAQVGATASCYAGPSGTSGKGLCKAGTLTCTAGSWSDCAGQIGPKEEVCNGLDDDCDGKVDGMPSCPRCVQGRTSAMASTTTVTGRSTRTGRSTAIPARLAASIATASSPAKGCAAPAFSAVKRACCCPARAM